MVNLPRLYLQVLAPRPLMPTGPTIRQLSYNWSTDRASAPVVAIIAHNTVGFDSRTYLSRGGELPDGSDRKVSIHSLIQKDGTLYRYVPDERGANHAGYGKMPPGYPRLNPNRCTIGIEIENASNGKGRVDPYTPAQLLTFGWEVNRIRAKFGNIPLLRHADIDAARRADTVGLTIPEMEAWAEKAKAYFTVSLPTRRYRVKADMFWLEDRRADAPIANQGRALLQVGDVVAINDVTNGWAHAANGIGFTLMAGLEETQ